MRADLSSLFQENLNSLREQLEESQREKEESSTELVDLREKVKLLFHLVAQRHQIAELRLQKDKSDKQRKELEEYIKEAEVHSVKVFLLTHPGARASLHDEPPGDRIGDSQRREHRITTTSEGVDRRKGEAEEQLRLRHGEIHRTPRPEIS